MKIINCFAILMVIMLVISQTTGCGRDEDKAKEVAPEAIVPQSVVEPAAPQSVIEQKIDLPGEDNANISQETGATEVLVTQPAVQEIIDVIMIENQGYTADKKGPVEFSHLKHNKEYGVTCVQCHHLYKDGENLWKEGDHVDKCVVCHDPVEEKDESIKLQTAFHKNCRDCHNEVNKEGKEAPDKRCNDCHG